MAKKLKTFTDERQVRKYYEKREHKQRQQKRKFKRGEF